MKAILIAIIAVLSFVSLHGQVTLTMAPEAYYCPPCNNSCDQLSFESAGTCKHCGMVLINKQQNKERKV
jgi:hypothetical protein